MIGAQKNALGVHSGGPGQGLIGAPHRALDRATLKDPIKNVFVIFLDLSGPGPLFK